MSDQMRDAMRSWARAARTNPLFWRTLVGASLILIIDQASKLWIVHGLKLPARRHIDLSPILDLSFVANRGAIFGSFAGGTVSRIGLSVIALGVVTGLIVWLGRLERRIAALGITFIVGGAIGNVIDRIRLGYVVDFLDLSDMYFPWVFNIADVAIDIGIACFIIDAFMEHKNEAGMVE